MPPMGRSNPNRLVDRGQFGRAGSRGSTQMPLGFHDEPGEFDPNVLPSIEDSSPVRDAPQSRWSAPTHGSGRDAPPLDSTEIVSPEA
ncbi:hypothetical protein PG994_004268 [Apiospora phragmitis]|uniref:Uncharacterized protein n=1 Tax=Apiospora phragmitis TaxID=2905665 RepID=A0ABR1VTY9_9PEZI